MQQLQRAAAGADKDVFGVNSLRFPALHILNRYVPGVVGITFEIRYLRGGLQGEVVIFLQAADQLASDFAVVDIGTHRRPKVAATFCCGSRPSITSGAHCLICA